MIVRQAFRFFSTSLVLAMFAVTQAAAATWYVNSNDDDADNSVGDGVCWTGGWVFVGMFGVYECTLRAALQEANAVPGQDMIGFSSQLDPNVFGTVVISVGSALPTITDPVTIDGTTIPEYDAADADAVPVIVIDGGLLGGSAIDGFTVGESGDGSKLIGLAIIRFPDNGVHLAGGDNVAIQGSHIGLDRGFVVRGNGGAGIYIASSSIGTHVGTEYDLVEGFAGRGNVISGNGENGVTIAGNLTYVGGNRIGTDRFGLTSSNGGGNHANGWRGIHLLSNATTVHIGRIGSTILPPADHVSGNLISGNTLGGVLVSGTGSNILIRGNLIGLAADGATPIGNGAGPGIRILTDDVVIGETGLGGNVVSGHAYEGILIGDNAGGSISGAEVINNIVGLDATGSFAVGNGGHGIHQVQGSTAEIADNLVGGNAGDGIRLEASYSEVYGNLIGTNSARTDLGNAGDGLFVRGTSNELGVTGSGNVIGFNRIGIKIAPGSIESRLRGNHVGTDPAGEAFGNLEDGVEMLGSHNIMGSTDPADANYVGHNGDHGVHVLPGTYSADIRGNWIGTNEAGLDLGNGRDGLHIENAFGTAIGAYPGTPSPLVPTYANHIAWNGENGVRIVGPDANDNDIRGNVFGENEALAIDLGTDGATPNDAGDADVGENFLQNSAVIDAAGTEYDTVSGDLTIEYAVDSDPLHVSYPLVVDFYAIGPDGEEPEAYLGSHSYLQSDAGLPVSAIFPPAIALTGLETIAAIATDADGNSSEVGNRIPLPEPGLATMLAAGGLALTAGRASRRR